MKSSLPSQSPDNLRCASKTELSDKSALQALTEKPCTNMFKELPPLQVQNSMR